MDFTYHLLKNGLSGAQLKQDTIMHNIANVNTQGYIAKKVDFEKHLRSAVSMHRNEGRVDMQAQVTPRKDYSTKIGRDGNNVDMNKEMIDLSTNQLYFQGLVDQVNKKLAIRRYVITGGNR